MATLASGFRIATWVIHGLAAIALSLLWAKAGAMAGWCIFPGLLIACASVAASPGRPVTAYAAFGALMGFSFWASVSALRAAEPIALIPTLLMIVGVSWFLREADWPSFVFTAVLVAFWLALMRWLYDKRFELDHADPADAIRVVQVSVVVLIVGAVYLAASFAEVVLAKARRKKKKSRSIRTPVDPPMF